MAAFFNITASTSYANNMARNARIAEVIADLKGQDRPNIAATARRYQIARETLSKCYRGETGTI